MNEKPTNRIEFVAEYVDGNIAEFTVNRWSLRPGDHVARIIAMERQITGELPPGEVKAVRRSHYPAPS